MSTDAETIVVPTTTSDKDVSPPPPRTLHVERRDSKSLLMSFLHTLIRPLRPRLVTLSSKQQPPGSRKLTPPKKLRKHCTVAERQVEDIWLYDISCPQRGSGDKSAAAEVGSGPARPTRRMLYFAGGGWQMPPGGEHWAFLGALAKGLASTGLVVTLVSYPMGPHSPAHVSLPQLMKMYHAVMEESLQNGEEVILAGDSSGGNIALCLVATSLHEMDSQGAKVLRPDQLMVISPSADLTHDEPQIMEAAKWDPILTPAFIQSTARAWSEGVGHQAEDVWQKNDPRVSPAYADAGLFVKYGIKIHGVTGTWDVLGPEAQIYRDRLSELGVEGRWLEWQRQMHCFPLAFGYGLKESKAAVEWIIDVLKT